MPAHAAGPKQWCNGTVIPQFKNAAGGKSDTPISGKVRRVTHWGPPNFGENPKTDSKFVSWMLELDAPLTVALNPSSSEQGSFSRINISHNGHEAEIAKLRDKHVRIMGNLLAADVVPYQDASSVSVVVSAIQASPDVVCGARQRQ